MKLKPITQVTECQYCYSKMVRFVSIKGQYRQVCREHYLEALKMDSEQDKG